VTGATEFALETDTRCVERARVGGEPWRTALRFGVVVVVTELASPMIEPATDGIDKTRWVKFVYGISNAKFWMVGSYLTPSFVVDDLSISIH
jgi:hypothetical protein